MVSVINSATRVYGNQKDDLIAIRIAQSTMEQVLAYYPDHEDLARDTTHGPLHFDGKGEASAELAYFQASWTVEDHGSIDGLASLTVEVAWLDEASRPRATSLTTLRSVQ